MKNSVKALSLFISSIMLLSLFFVNGFAANNESAGYFSRAEKICTITYDANGGVVTPAYDKVLAGVPFDLPTPTRDGYTFVGWTANKNASNADFSGGETVVPDGNLTLYAIWQKIDENVKPFEPAVPEIPDNTENPSVPTLPSDSEADVADIFSKIVDFIVKAVTWFVEFISSLIQQQA